jgi:hypothetical protein
MRKKNGTLQKKWREKKEKKQREKKREGEFQKVATVPKRLREGLENPVGRTGTPARVSLFRSLSGS